MLGEAKSILFSGDILEVFKEKNTELRGPATDWALPCQIPE